jgi:hypothetical protein
MRRGLWLFLTLAAGPGIAAEFAMADDANRSLAAPAIDGNRSSDKSIYVAGAAGSWRRIRRTTATLPKVRLCAIVLREISYRKNKPQKKHNR